MKEWEMQIGLRKPETAEKAKEQATMDGMRRAIQEATRDSPLIRGCLDRARYAGLSGEDTYVLLAYQALLSLEDYYKRVMEFANLDTRSIRIELPGSARDRLDAAK